MNRRSFFTFIGLAPVAIATGAVAATGPGETRGMRGAEPLKVELKADFSELTAALEDVKIELEFERHGADWLQRAYADNIKVIERVWAPAGKYSVRIVPTDAEICFRDFVGPDDDVFITPSAGSIYIFNKATNREAFVSRPALRIIT